MRFARCLEVTLRQAQCDTGTLYARLLSSVTLRQAQCDTGTALHRQFPQVTLRCFDFAQHRVLSVTLGRLRSTNAPRLGAAYKIDLMAASISCFDISPLRINLTLPRRSMKTWTGNPIAPYGFNTSPFASTIAL